MLIDAKSAHLQSKQAEKDNQHKLVKEQYSIVADRINKAIALGRLYINFDDHLYEENIKSLKMKGYDVVVNGQSTTISW